MAARAVCLPASYPYRSRIHLGFIVVTNQGLFSVIASEAKQSRLPSEIASGLCPSQ